jgi:hypothetical protein
MPEKKTDKIDRGVKPAAAQFSPSSRVELFGHVILVQAYDLSSYVGCHALVTLRDTPGKTVAVLTSEPRLQSLLEAALTSGDLVAFWGHKLSCVSAPLGGSWTVDVYGVDSVILYNTK